MISRPRVQRRLAPFIDAAVERQPEPTRDALRHALDEHRGLRIALERLGPDDRWHVVVAVAAEPRRISRRWPDQGRTQVGGTTIRR